MFEGDNALLLKKAFRNQEGGKEGRKKGRKGRREEGRKGGRKEGRKEGNEEIQLCIRLRKKGHLQTGDHQRKLALRWKAKPVGLSHAAVV
eukprot:1133811-Pelagomonas_calceolata.AAC.2